MIIADAVLGAFTSLVHESATGWATCLSTYPLIAPFTILGLLSVMTYGGCLLVQWFVCDLALSDNLMKRYDAQWAVVTGGSSGIGRAIVEKLASQDVNVVIVALQDSLLDSFHAEVGNKFPHLKFRKVGVSLAERDESVYMKPIIAATSDIHVSLLFNNAGFICVGLFSDVPVGKWLANMHCNATCAIPITHHFLNRMIQSKRPGLLAYTSSSACLFPNPLSSLYASTKAFLTMFAASVAAEVRSLNIDVVVVHPSPMATNFFKAGEGLDMLMAFKKIAAGPAVIADVIFSSAGRFVVRDQVWPSAERSEWRVAHDGSAADAGRRAGGGYHSLPHAAESAGHQLLHRAHIVVHPHHSGLQKVRSKAGHIDGAIDTECRPRPGGLEPPRARRPATGRAAFQARGSDQGLEAWQSSTQEAWLTSLSARRLEAVRSSSCSSQS